MIYFARLAGGTIKIGYTAKAPAARMAQLRIHYRSDVELLRAIPGEIQDERALHRRFREHRVGGSEQFFPCEELLSLIGISGEHHVSPEGATPLFEGKLVKLEAGLAGMARAVATSKGITTADYLAELSRERVMKDYLAMLKEQNLDAESA